MEEFRSNLLLLLHCRYPQGMLLEKLEEEYEKYYQKRVEPYMFSQDTACNSWRLVFEKTYLHNDLKLFEINNALYVKPIGIRSEAEMTLIAKLAKYSHFHYAQDVFFQIRDCSCCQVFRYDGINHYGGTQQNINSNPSQFTGANTAMNPSESNYRTVQYVTTPSNVQQGGRNSSGPAGSIAATNLSMNGDYYIMLSNTPNIQNRYETVQNTPQIQGHTSRNEGMNNPNQTSVIYSTQHIQNNQNNRQQHQASPRMQQNQNHNQWTSSPKPANSNMGNQKSIKRANSSSKDQRSQCKAESGKKSFRKSKALDNIEQFEQKLEVVPFTCASTGCKLTFNDKKSLQQHESRCTYKPHKCSWIGCDKTFRTSKLLHGHVSAVHRKVGRNTYKCSVPGCVQAYPDSTKLKTHEARCRFKYETLKEMAIEAGLNTSDGSGMIGYEACKVEKDTINIKTESPLEIPVDPQVAAVAHMSVDPVDVKPCMPIDGGDTIGEEKPSTVDLSFMSPVKTGVPEEVDNVHHVFVQQPQDHQM